MVGDRFKENAVLRSDGVFYNFGIIPKLRSLFAVNSDEPIYEVEFKVVEEKPEYPLNKSNNIEYFGFYNNGKYSLIQPTAEMFGMQFPWDVWEYQGKEKYQDKLGNKIYFGIIVRIEPINYVELKEN